MCRLSPLESFLETSQFQLLESLSLFVQGTPNRSVFFLSLGGAAPPEARASLCAARERSRAIWKSPALIRSESSIELVEQERGEGEIQPPAIASSKRQSTRGSPCCSYCSLSLSAASFARVSRSGFPKACDCQKPAKRALPTDGRFALSLSLLDRRRRCRRSLALSPPRSHFALTSISSPPTPPSSTSKPSYFHHGCPPRDQAVRQVVLRGRRGTNECCSSSRSPAPIDFFPLSFHQSALALAVFVAVLPADSRRFLLRCSDDDRGRHIGAGEDARSRSKRLRWKEVESNARVVEREGRAADGKTRPPHLSFAHPPPPLFLSLSLALPNPTDPAQNRSTTSPSRTTSP